MLDLGLGPLLIYTLLSALSTNQRYPTVGRAHACLAHPASALVYHFWL